MEDTFEEERTVPTLDIAKRRSPTPQFPPKFVHLPTLPMPFPIRSISAANQHDGYHVSPVCEKKQTATATAYPSRFPVAPSDVSPKKEEKSEPGE